MANKHEIEQFFRELQDEICTALETTDGKARFQEDLWTHHTGGGGRTRLIQDGAVIEKGGVNFSAVEGPAGEDLKRQLEIDFNADFFATGVSIVQHPNNPLMPIIHMNVRYFELSDGTYWFGGGIDLTPHYVDDAQAQWFHAQLKAVCDAHDPAFYTQYKKWADDYFYIKHREETRGIGGIFFDHLNEGSLNKSKDEIFAFVKAVGQTFAPIYTHLMKLNGEKPFTEAQKEWQYIRRGRYVEFNLVWDRGTKFGLSTGGRTESILMSLPKEARWFYNHQPEEGSEEALTLSKFKKGIDWV
ncbi:oxygen-dependent coproporphyrinogen oxidase [Marinilongibacter aquaticus]|uniref:oxygen-dependent coproporphyrinogen oxidase n=1 Tax=Marinilongibacter aquaticus TaxID=2975157 RepID=UPI0021BDF006|nr:oxygen-dependent coproporphyrinogen oxidase [Marinilongibacter aquaticus]UBM59608.1 oxygen-dependent coproporphyrinogen oxidase [Marinilongibacter aquaticus]